MTVNSKLLKHYCIKAEPRATADSRACRVRETSSYVKGTSELPERRERGGRGPAKVDFVEDENGWKVEDWVD